MANRKVTGTLSEFFYVGKQRNLLMSYKYRNKAPTQLFYWPSCICSLILYLSVHHYSVFHLDQYSEKLLGTNWNMFHIKDFLMHKQLWSAWSQIIPKADILACCHQKNAEISSLENKSLFPHTHTAERGLLTHAHVRYKITYTVAGLQLCTHNHQAQCGCMWNFKYSPLKGILNKISLKCPHLFIGKIITFEFVVPFY